MREAAGLFDVSHMGEVWFRGPRAAEAVQRIVTNDVGKLADGRRDLHAAPATPTGGIVDDLIVYRAAPRRSSSSCNASNLDKDFAWFKTHVGDLCDFDERVRRDRADRRARAARRRAGAVAVRRAASSALKSFTFRDGDVAGVPCTVARTGYTGEDGFEIFAPATQARRAVGRAARQRRRTVG